MRLTLSSQINPPLPAQILHLFRNQTFLPFANSQLTDRQENQNLNPKSLTTVYFLIYHSHFREGVVCALRSKSTSWS